jgi:hypothetical protein
MDINELKDKLKSCHQSNDKEEAHKDADQILCSLLIECGFPDIVEEYCRVSKWYS